MKDLFKAVNNAWYEQYGTVNADIKELRGQGGRNMEQKLLKDLKKGEFFTKKPIEEPKESQVVIRRDYDMSEKKYEITRFSDFCDTAYLKGTAKIYTGFTF